MNIIQNKIHPQIVLKPVAIIMCSFKADVTLTIIILRLDTYNVEILNIQHLHGYEYIISRIINISWDSGPSHILPIVKNILSSRFDQMLKAYIVAEFKYDNLVQMFITCPTSTI